MPPPQRKDRKTPKDFVIGAFGKDKFHDNKSDIDESLYEVKMIPYDKGCIYHLVMKE